jgi:hypothetical protein
VKRTFLRRSLLLLFLLSFVLIRLEVLFFPESTGWAPLVDELPTGNIAADLGRGLVLPPPAYQFKPFAAGTMLEGILAAPFRAVIGPNLLSLKFAAMTLQLAALALWFLALWRLGGPVAAIAFGLLFTFPPPAWLHFSHTAWGNHAEQALFSGAVLLIASGRQGRVESGRAFAMGLVAGLAAYFAYSGLPTVVWALALAAGLGGLRMAVPAAGGALVGVAPLAWSASFFGWGALGRIDTYTGYGAGEVVSAGRGFLERNLGAAPGKAWRLLTEDLPAASLYPAAWNRWLFFGLVVAGLVGIVWWARRLRHDGRKRAALLWAAAPIYGVLYAAVLVVSGFRVGRLGDIEPKYYMEIRYLAPLFPVAFAAVGLGLQALWDRLPESPSRRGRLIVAAGLAMAVLTLPFYGTYRVPTAFSRTVLDVRGDLYTHVVQGVAMTVAQNKWRRSDKMALLERLPQRYHRLFFEDLGNTGEQGLHLGMKLAEQTDLPVRPDVVRGYGRFTGGLLAGRERGGWSAELAATLAANNWDEPPWRQAFLEGAGTGLVWQAGLPAAQVLRQLAETGSSEADLNALAIGIGQFSGGTVSYNLTHLNDLPLSFWRGYGRQLRRNAENVLLSREPVARQIQGASPERARAILQGYIEAGRLFVEAP